MSRVIALLRLLGAAINVIGIPGLVRDGEYRSMVPTGYVRVRRQRLYTVVTVNGLDIYFGRFSGRIDGVGSNNIRGR